MTTSQATARAGGQSGELRPDLRGGGGHDVPELVEGFEGGATGDHQHPDRLHVPVAGFRQPRRLTGQHNSGCRHGIDRI